MFSFPLHEPQDDEEVVYVVKTINHKEGFALTSLPDYSDMGAMLPFSHLSRKRSLRSVKKYLSVGRKDVGRIHSLTSDSEGFCHPILSRVGVEEEDRAKGMEDFAHRQRLRKWVHFLAYQLSKAGDESDKDEGSSENQELYSTLIHPLMVDTDEEEDVDTPKPWIILRDTSPSTLMEDGKAWAPLRPTSGKREAWLPCHYSREGSLKQTPPCG